MDGRLEVPTRSTFQTYIRLGEWLNQNDPRWDTAIARLGDPLVLISHDGWSDAEAALLSHPRWRCLYFDEIASVFVTRSGPTSSPTFPDFNFLASHFAQRPEGSASMDLRATAAQAAALLQLSRSVRKQTGDPWKWRIPILIRVSDLTRSLLAGERLNPAAWWRSSASSNGERSPT